MAQGSMHLHPSNGSWRDAEERSNASRWGHIQPSPPLSVSSDPWRPATRAMRLGTRAGHGGCKVSEGPWLGLPDSPASSAPPALGPFKSVGVWGQRKGGLRPACIAWPFCGEAPWPMSEALTLVDAFVGTCWHWVTLNRFSAETSEFFSGTDPVRDWKEETDISPPPATIPKTDGRTPQPPPPLHGHPSWTTWPARASRLVNIANTPSLPPVVLLPFNLKPPLHCRRGHSVPVVGEPCGSGCAGPTPPVRKTLHPRFSTPE